MTVWSTSLRSRRRQSEQHCGEGSQNEVVSSVYMRREMLGVKRKKLRVTDASTPFGIYCPSLRAMSRLGTQLRGISGENLWSKKQSVGTNETQWKRSTIAVTVLNENVRTSFKVPHVVPVPHFVKSEEESKRVEKENESQLVPKPFSGNLRCRIPIRILKCSAKPKIETRPSKRAIEVRKSLGLTLAVRNSTLRWLECARNSIIAKRHRKRVLLKQTIRDWRFQTEEGKKEWRLGIRAIAKYRSGLLRFTWKGWRTLLRLEKEKRSKREQQAKLANLAKTSRKFHAWRNLLNRRRAEREREAWAENARRRFHLARTFGTWRAVFSSRKFWKERDDTAHQMYLHKQRHRTFDFWYFLYLERSALREREDRLRRRHRKQMLEVIMTVWLDYADYRKLKLEQAQVASQVYNKHATEIIWRRWRSRQMNQLIRHEQSNEAEKYHFLCVLRGAFWTWKQKFRLFAYNRQMVQSLMVARTKKLKQCFFRGLKSLIGQRNTADKWSTKKREISGFSKWYDAAMARIAAREEEAMRPGKAIYDGRLMRRFWAAWHTRTKERRCYAVIYMKACKHRRQKELSKAFGALNAYRHHKSAYRKECAISSRFGKKRQLMRTWDVWQQCLMDRAITARCFQKACEFYIFKIQRKYLLALRTHACTSLAMQEKKEGAIAHSNAKVLNLVVNRWHMYSSVHGQRLRRLQQATERSSLKLLQQHWRHWIELCIARDFKRRELFLSEITYRRTVVQKCFQQWRRTAAFIAERQRRERSIINSIDRKKLRNRFALWKSEWRRLQWAKELLREKELEKSGKELGKYFTLWLDALKMKQEERRKENDRLDVISTWMAESKKRRHFSAWMLYRRKKARINASYSALKLMRQKKVLHVAIVKWVNEARVKIWHKESAHDAVRFRNRLILRIFFLRWWNLRPSYKEIYHRTHAQPVLYWSYTTLRKFLGAWHRWATERVATRELLRRADERRRRRVTRDACIAWIGGSGSKFQEKERKWEAEARKNLALDGLKSGSILMEANIKRLRVARRCAIRWRAEVLARKIEKERKSPVAATSLTATRMECNEIFLDSSFRVQRGQTWASRCNPDTLDRSQPRFPHAILHAPLFEIPITSGITCNDTKVGPPRSEPVTVSNKLCQMDHCQEHSIKGPRPAPRLPEFYMDESYILQKTG